MRFSQIQWSSNLCTADLLRRLLGFPPVCYQSLGFYFKIRTPAWFLLEDLTHFSSSHLPSWNRRESSPAPVVPHPMDPPSAGSAPASSAGRGWRSLEASGCCVPIAMIAIWCKYMQIFYIKTKKIQWQIINVYVLIIRLLVTGLQHKFHLNPKNQTSLESNAHEVSPFLVLK